jgi:hypothetical protein
MDALPWRRLTQGQRDKVMGQFRELKPSDYLIATDAAARGIDVQGITHVINLRYYQMNVEVLYFIEADVLVRLVYKEFVCQSFIRKKCTNSNRIERIDDSTVPQDGYSNWERCLSENQFFSFIG